MNRDVGGDRHDTITAPRSDVVLADSPTDVARDALELVTRQVRLFCDAWPAAGAPPRLIDFLPDANAAARRLVLVELVKVDLSRRWRRAELRRTLEDYLRDFPDLALDGCPPLDVVLEEYQARREAGEEVEVKEYEARFPRHAEQLRRLLDDADRARTTSLAQVQPLDDLQPGEQLDEFDLLLLLGKGAFARVFLARQRSMQRLVALKVSADRSDEPQTMAQLDHPHIVRVYDQRLLAGRDLRLLYMQYVAGGTLQGVVKLVRRVPADARTGALLFKAIDESLAARGESAMVDSPLRERLSARSWPQVVCWLGVRIASALDYAHRHGVLHRDMKPANVLVSAEGSPKLADFNISFCSKVEGATPAAYFGGSLHYMSPEQLEAFNPLHARRADEIDARSDVYALGVVLWELLSGELPFRDPPLSGDMFMALEDMVARRRRPPPKPLAENLPGGLAETLMRCLAADPAARFATAGQLARQLEICLQPRAQRLLLPREGWRSLAQRFAIAALLIAGLIPNAVASALSIAYNQTTVISRLGSEAQRLFEKQLVVINPLAYSLAVAWLLWLAWPVVKGVQRGRAGTTDPPERRAKQRRRCLQIGDWVAWVTAAAWLVCGVIFPLWLRADARTASAMTRPMYASFFTALLVCGLMAATLSFFCVTFLAVRAFFPRLIDTEVHDLQSLAELAALGRRSGYYFLAAVSVPFIAMLAVVLLLEGNARTAVLGLGVAGLGAFFAAYRLWREIQHDLDALAALVDPATSLGDTGSIAGDSSWASLR